MSDAAQAVEELSKEYRWGFVTDIEADGTFLGELENTAGETITGNYGDAHAVFDGLASVGIDFADVTQVLEDEGVDKFIASWHELQATVTTALENADV